METQTILQFFLDQYQTAGNTISDISFNNLPFLYAKEPNYNMKGCKVSKSYFDKFNREAIRIVYKKIIDNYTYNSVIYNDVFVGVRKTIKYYNFSGEIVYTKDLQPYYFNLQPIFIGDGTETITGFSSQKQLKILKEERYAANEWLNAQNPTLYSLLYDKYSEIYQSYLLTGFKDNLVSALNSETDEAILNLLNNEVYGMEPMTIKELIILNLQ